MLQGGQRLEVINQRAKAIDNPAVAPGAAPFPAEKTQVAETAMARRTLHVDGRARMASRVLRDLDKPFACAVLLGRHTTGCVSVGGVKPVTQMLAGALPYKDRQAAVQTDQQQASSPGFWTAGVNALGTSERGTSFPSTLARSVGSDPAGRRAEHCLLASKWASDSEAQSYWGSGWGAINDGHGSVGFCVNPSLEAQSIKRASGMAQSFTTSRR